MLAEEAEGEDEDEAAKILTEETTRIMTRRNQIQPNKVQEVKDVDVDVVEEGMTNLQLNVIHAINLAIIQVNGEISKMLNKLIMHKEMMMKMEVILS